MASEKAFQAMARGDWNVVTEMLDMDELSTADINQPHPMVDIHRSSLYICCTADCDTIDQLLIITAILEYLNDFTFPVVLPATN